MNVSPGTARIVRVTVERPGKGTTQYDEHLVADDAGCKVLYLPTHDHRAANDDGATILTPGSPIIWFVFPDRWFEIGSFHTPGGKLVGWYTNICTPFEFGPTTWHTTDLFLDCWQPIGREPRFIDEDELEAAVSQKLIGPDTLKKIDQTRKLIERESAKGAWPPHPVQEFDLTRVRASL